MIVVCFALKIDLIFVYFHYRGVSHSAMTDMQVIEQEQPSTSRSKFDSYEKKSSKGRSFFDDELDDYSSSSSKYGFLENFV